MDTQNPERRERNSMEDHAPSTAQKILKPIFAGAIASGIGYFFYRLLKKIRTHVIPPIIIKSFEETGEPIEIESEHPLEVSEALSGEARSSLASRKVYTSPDFDLTKHVRIHRRFTKPEHITRFDNPDSGLEVRMWLQYKDGPDWRDLDDGPHFELDGTLPGAPLTCEELSADKPSGNSERPRKRSFDRSGKWRISRVEVDGAVVEREHYKKMEIRLYDEDPDQPHPL